MRFLDTNNNIDRASIIDILVSSGLFPDTNVSEWTIVEITDDPEGVEVLIEAKDNDRTFEALCVVTPDNRVINCTYMG